MKKGFKQIIKNMLLCDNDILFKLGLKLFKTHSSDFCIREKLDILDIMENFTIKTDLSLSYKKRSAKILRYLNRVFIYKNYLESVFTNDIENYGGYIVYLRSMNHNNLYNSDDYLWDSNIMPELEGEW